MCGNPKEQIKGQLVTIRGDRHPTLWIHRAHYGLRYKSDVSFSECRHQGRRSVGGRRHRAPKWHDQCDFGLVSQASLGEVVVCQQD